MPTKKRIERNRPSLAEAHLEWASTFDPTALCERRTSAPGAWRIDTYAPNETLRHNLRDLSWRLVVAALHHANVDYEQRLDMENVHRDRAHEAKKLANAVRTFVFENGRDATFFGAHDPFDFNVITPERMPGASEVGQSLQGLGLSFASILDAFADQRGAIPRGTNSNRLAVHFARGVNHLWPRLSECMELDLLPTRIDFALCLWADAEFPMPSERARSGADREWMSAVFSSPEVALENS